MLGDGGCDLAAGGGKLGGVGGDVAGDRLCEPEGEGCRKHDRNQHQYAGNGLGMAEQIAKAFSGINVAVVDQFMQFAESGINRLIRALDVLSIFSILARRLAI